MIHVLFEVVLDLLLVVRVAHACVRRQQGRLQGLPVCWQHRLQFRLFDSLFDVGHQLLQNDICLLPGFFLDNVLSPALVVCLHWLDAVCAELLAEVIAMLLQDSNLLLHFVVRRNGLDRHLPFLLRLGRLLVLLVRVDHRVVVAHHHLAKHVLFVRVCHHFVCELGIARSVHQVVVQTVI